MDREKSLKLTDAEIAASFGDSYWRERFPPVLTIEQAADLIQMPVATLRDWRARRLLATCCRKVGRHLRFYRDRLLKVAFNDGLLHEK